MRFILIFILLSQKIYCQDSVAGVVMTSAKHPVIYSTVSIESTAFGTYSDSLGRFMLRHLKLNDTILVSALGFEEKRVLYTGQDFVRVELTQQPILLNEVVVSREKVKGKWRKVSKRIKPYWFNILLEGTTILYHFKDKNIKEIAGIRFRLRRNNNAQIVLRPCVTAWNNPEISFLSRDYTQLFFINKNDFYVEFEFNEIVTIPPEGVNMGIEVIDIVDNRNYEDGITIDFSTRGANKTFRKGKNNFVQKSGIQANFDKQFDKNLYFELKVIK